jgi:hypothetical protein
VTCILYSIHIHSVCLFFGEYYLWINTVEISDLVFYCTVSVDVCKAAHKPKRQVAGDLDL